MNLPKFEDYDNQVVQYISPKMDGHMCHVYVDERGNVRCMSKNGKDMTEKVMNVKHIKDELHRLPYSSELFTELHHPEVLATSVPTMLIEGDKRCRMSVFAAPVLDGYDLHDTSFNVVMDAVAKFDIETVPFVKCPAPGRLNKTMVEMLLMSAEASNLEGYVLKLSHMDEWYKLKPVKTIDAVVFDVTESDSETYRGHMKAVRLGVYDSDCSIHDLGECGGGFTKEFKLSMTYIEALDKLVGQVCEVAYQSITKHKKLQFPRFVRWRSDKDKSQCTTEQLQ